MSRTEVTASIEVLLDPKVKSADVMVLGLGLGDVVSRVPSDLVVGAHCQKVPCVSRSWNSDGDHQIQRDGEPELRPYPVAERFDDVCEHGGWIEVELPPGGGQEGKVKLEVADGVISDLHLSGAWLDTLGLDSPAAITDKLGPNDRYGRAYLKTTWAWPDRNFAVIWDDKENALSSVSFGPTACDRVPVFDAKSLIRLAVAWRRIHPEDDWPPTPRRDLESERVEASRLTALLSAFGVFKEGSPSLSRFFRGEFLAKDDDTARKALIRFLSSTDEGQPRLDPEEAVWTHRHVRFFWERVLRFRLHLEHVAEFNAEVLMASGLYLHTVEIAGHVAKKIEPDRNHLDRALALLLDPTRRVFSWGQLVREFEFPDDDLDELSAEDLL